MDPVVVAFGLGAGAPSEAGAHGPAWAIVGAPLAAGVAAVPVPCSRTRAAVTAA